MVEPRMLPRQRTAAAARPLSRLTWSEIEIDWCRSETVRSVEMSSRPVGLTSLVRALKLRSGHRRTSPESRPPNSLSVRHLI
jgi:hypothetical protein